VSIRVGLIVRVGFTRRVGVALRRGMGVNVLLGYVVNVNVASGVPIKAVSDGIGDCVEVADGVEVAKGVGVFSLEAVGGEVGVERGVCVGVVWGACVATGRVLIEPFGVTVAAGVCR